MGRSKSTEVLDKSSSGSIAFELAKYCCENGYDIIGCTYDNENRIAKHKRVIAGDLSQIHIFQGSKYLQSHFEEIINDVAASRKTLVFGTPCQVAGIDNLLRVKENRDNYVLVDLICHGVPSNNLWHKYLDELNKEYHCESKPNVEFRHKQMGWRKMHIKVFSNDNIYMNSDTKDVFFRFFKSGNCYANSCYECNYRTASCADIRLGDYWGEKYKKDKQGVSMVLALSKKGEMLLESLHNNNTIDLEQNDINDYWTIQLPYNPKKPLFYEHLMSDLKKNESTLEVLANKYCKQYEQMHVIYKIAGKCKIAV
jgi:coenzyme F420-reducing hydrogenase beta subunit